ncbi:hypothetical protein E3N88_10253 [Mikania micrantha]|uniref:Uncharacterized protein n=1 Tax=Mikania micrantha TaxID=192012 RepID=A0A5N6PBU9_9ASTR|nr:hypothetical protein E3N88_10253 [Mikania micrantha]
MLKISVRNRIRAKSNRRNRKTRKWTHRGTRWSLGERLRVREANRESRLPNPIAEHRGRIEELSIDKKVEIQLLEGPPEAILARVLHLSPTVASHMATPTGGRNSAKLTKQHLPYLGWIWWEAAC